MSATSKKFMCPNRRAWAHDVTNISFCFLILSKSNKSVNLTAQTDSASAFKCHSNLSPGMVSLIETYPPVWSVWSNKFWRQVQVGVLDEKYWIMALVMDSLTFPHHPIVMQFIYISLSVSLSKLNITQSSANFFLFAPFIPIR